MLGEHALGYVGGAGSCAGCGEATADPHAGGRHAPGPRARVDGHRGRHGLQHGLRQHLPVQPVPGAVDQLAVRERPGRCAWASARAGTQDGHPERRLWVLGGDGAMYDIGFQSLSRMVASGADIKVWCSTRRSTRTPAARRRTATFGGQVTKLSAFGKALHGRPERRKELGRILMAHGDVYVAQTTPAHLNHFYRTVLDANEYPGPAVVIVYTPCMPEHGIADDASTRQAKLAVQSRAFPLFVYDPRKGDDHRRAAEPAGQPAPSRTTGSPAPDGSAAGLPGLRPDRGPLRASTSARTARQPPRSRRPRRTAWPTGGRSRSSPASAEEEHVIVAACRYDRARDRWDLGRGGPRMLAGKPGDSRAAAPASPTTSAAGGTTCRARWTARPSTAPWPTAPTTTRWPSSTAAWPMPRSVTARCGASGSRAAGQQARPLDRPGAPAC